MKNSGSPERSQAKSAARALDVLEALVRESRGLSFTDLLRLLGIPKSSLHELLAVLVERGYVQYDEASRLYTLGVRVWESGQAYLRHHELVGEAHAVMQGIVDELNETVQLAVLDGIENVYLGRVDCSHPLRLQSEVGKRLSAHATGLGKVLLAYLPVAERDTRLGGQALVRYTPRTITDLAALGAELAAVRARGFAVDDQEYTPGLRCVAVPVYDVYGRPSAAMSVSIPIMRASVAECAAALSCLATASLALSRRLGCSDIDPLLGRLTNRLTAHDALTQFGDARSATEERLTAVGG
jgi:DNA-binding IclR family transcriptional regulator